MMRIYLMLVCLFLAGCASQQPRSESPLSQSGVPPQAQAGALPPPSHISAQPDVLPQTRTGWDAEQPERFDWMQYVGEGVSTIKEMNRAYYGIGVLQKRLDQIVASHQRRLASEPKQLKLFNEMQSQWQNLAGMETDFVANGWEGGSGQKSAIPSAQLRLLQARVLRLLELKSEALDLNE
jgi:hypothetical protein